MAKDFIIECCPHCMGEAAVEWDIRRDGHSIYCPYCGERIMLCSECPSRDDEMPCDWHEAPEGESCCCWDERREE